MAKEDASWFQEDNPWRKTTAHGAGRTVGWQLGAMPGFGCLGREVHYMEHRSAPMESFREGSRSEVP